MKIIFQFRKEIDELSCQEKWENLRENEANRQKLPVISRSVKEHEVIERGSWSEIKGNSAYNPFTFRLKVSW